MGGRAVMLLLAVQAVLLSSHPRSATGDWLGPVASPFFKGLCEVVQCGKGRCRTDSGRTFGYVCECDAGWTKLSTRDDRFQYLPCVIPNCTLNYKCSNTSAAAPAAPPSLSPLPPPSDHPLFDPCTWSYCGEGTCVKTSKFGHRCDCKPGYTNLLNSTAYPCVRECVLGADCAGLGIALPNVTSSQPDQVGRAANNSRATASSPRGLLWVPLLMTALAIMPRWS